MTGYTKRLSQIAGGDLILTGGEFYGGKFLWQRIDQKPYEAVLIANTLTTVQMHESNLEYFIT